MLHKWDKKAEATVEIVNSMGCVFMKHECPCDKARHGKAFKGLLERYFG
ncbi:MAG: hypothetical protein ACI4IF_03465 [Acutalibacteraceae bacterium]